MRATILLGLSNSTGTTLRRLGLGVLVALGLAAAGCTSPHAPPVSCTADTCAAHCVDEGSTSGRCVDSVCTCTSPAPRGTVIGLATGGTVEARGTRHRLHLTIGGAEAAAATRDGKHLGLRPASEP